jgi:hypothetical protein
MTVTIFAYINIYKQLYQVFRFSYYYITDGT